MILPSSSVPILSPDKTYRVDSLCTCSIWCVLLERVHVISTGPISTVQTEFRGSASS
ncbi:unnamed protein product [Staurois parvus]|uniref:Uncharacterized protein n=1 Tax=Staurois parvus TaxID=386267 RepID=A0ABN9DRV1_9NEOB|nr:unnamed protein product [Staurois parvus]